MYKSLFSDIVVIKMRIVKDFELEIRRMEYPRGTRVILEDMDDIQAPPSGTKGEVQYVDDMGQIHVKWDNGSGLALIPGVDKFSRVN